MSRDPNSDRVEPGGGDIGHVRALGQHQREWSGPEFGGQKVCSGRPVASQDAGGVNIGHMGDHGIPRRTTLGRVDSCDRIGVEGVGAESVYGFGGKGDEAPAAKQFGRVLHDHRVGIIGIEPKERGASHVGI